VEMAPPAWAVGGDEQEAITLGGEVVF